MQYFYLQDIFESNKYKDRAARGILESNTSNFKRVCHEQGLRSSITITPKILYNGANISRTQSMKVKVTTIEDYNEVDDLLDKFLAGNEVRPPLEKIIAEITNRRFPLKLIRPSTPFSLINGTMLIQPSDGKSDQMIFPNMSCQEME